MRGRWSFEALGTDCASFSGSLDSTEAHSKPDRKDIYCHFDGSLGTGLQQ
jgi:hypothetical protein